MSTHEMSDEENLQQDRSSFSFSEEIPAIQEFRLSVQSLLRGSDKGFLEIADDLLANVVVQNHMSKDWAMEVTKEIFSSFGLEYTSSAWEEVPTPTAASFERESQRTDERESQKMEETDDTLLPTSDKPLPKRPISVIEDDESDGELPKWATPPQTPTQSILDGQCCLACSPSFRIPRPPTPPKSPIKEFVKPVAELVEDVKDPEPELTLSSYEPSTTKGFSFMSTLRRRFHKRSTPSLRVAKRKQAPPIAPPSRPPPLVPKHIPIVIPSQIPQAPPSEADVLSGPILKINRNSVISVMLTPEEREQIRRRRENESTLKEDFDLIVRLRTVRDVPRQSIVRHSIVSTVMGDFIPFGVNSATIPPVPMIDPTHLSTTPLESQVIEKAAPPKRLSKVRSRRYRLSRRKSSRPKQTVDKFNKQEEPMPQTTPSPVRNVLSEENLRILTNVMGLYQPPIPKAPDDMPDRMVMVTGQIQEESITDDTSFDWDELKSPELPIMTVPRSKRVSVRSRSSSRARGGDRSRTWDNAPVVQTTALGLRGGKIGAVQRGSALKANKILGDAVFIVPEKEQLRKKRVTRKDSIILPPTSKGSMTKVEQISGEKLLRERFPGDEPRKPGRRASSRHNLMADTLEKAGSSEVRMKREMSVERRISKEKGRLERSNKPEKLVKRNPSVQSTRPKSNGAVWII